MKYALLLIQMIPSIIEIVKTVEEIYPKTGKGQEKLALVREMLATAHEGVTEAWPKIEGIVSVVVKYLNQWGIFKKADA